jgi:D-alanyl-D-alanine carboxypeptidase/D-alanyl-D-alanine-endopeptidase (penicillin-binding protein 4)
MRRAYIFNGDRLINGSHEAFVNEEDFMDLFIPLSTDFPEMRITSQASSECETPSNSSLKLQRTPTILFVLSWIEGPLRTLNQIEVAVSKTNMTRILLLFLCLISAGATRPLIAQQPVPQQSPAAPSPTASPSASKSSVTETPTGQTQQPGLQQNGAQQPGQAVAREDSASTFGARGVLVETLDGHVVMESMSDQAFNPASAVKLATALVALHTFGPQHRFVTGVWTDGKFDRSTGVITGNLIISGRDPSFHYEHGVMLAEELNRQGVRSVTGDLIVAPGFTMNFDWSARRSGSDLHDTLDAGHRSNVAMVGWSEERAALGDIAAAKAIPSVAVNGDVRVGVVPTGASLILLHSSGKLTDILKVLLCYSNNFMAERIGDTVGGPSSITHELASQFGVPASEVKLSTSCGLGINRVTPRAMMAVLRALRDELGKNNLSLSDILPVAGIDPGTLQKRYTLTPSRGSVIAKTGTLVRTDGGASALVGQMHTATGETLLFVIFNHRGNVLRFRENQDSLVAQLQNAHGGPSPFDYRPIALAIRLADTLYNSKLPARTDEYEPGGN